MRTFRVTPATVCLLGLLAVVALGGCRRGLDDRQAREFIQRWQMAYNSHDLPSFTALYAEEGVFLPPGMLYPVRRRTALRETLDTMWRRPANLRIAMIHRVVAGGDQIAFLWTGSVTGGLTGQRWVLAGATFMRLEKGRIADESTVIRRQAARSPTVQKRPKGAAGSPPKR